MSLLSELPDEVSLVGVHTVYILRIRLELILSLWANLLSNFLRIGLLTLLLNLLIQLSLLLFKLNIKLFKLLGDGILLIL